MESFNVALLFVMLILVLVCCNAPLSINKLASLFISPGFESWTVQIRLWLGNHLLRQRERERERERREENETMRGKDKKKKRGERQV